MEILFLIICFIFLFILAAFSEDMGFWVGTKQVALEENIKKNIKNILKNNKENSRKSYRNQKRLVGNIRNIEELDEIMFETAKRFASSLEVSNQDIPLLGNALGIGYLLNTYFTFFIRSKVFPEDISLAEDFYSKDRDLVMGISTFFLIAKKNYKKSGSTLALGVEGLKHVSFLMHKCSKKNLEDRLCDKSEIIPLKELFRAYSSEYEKGVETLKATYKMIDINSEYERYSDDFNKLLLDLKLFVFDSPYDQTNY